MTESGPSTQPSPWIGLVPLGPALVAIGLLLLDGTAQMVVLAIAVVVSLGGAIAALKAREDANAQS